MAEYPAHLVRECGLSDGRTVTIRPVRPADGAREHDFLNQLSRESWHLRFHEFLAAPSDRLVQFFTHIDYDQHMAFVCAAPRGDTEELVGDARYMVSPDGKSCDFGIVIADAWHETGIGSLLMEALIRAARERGLATMEGIVLASNVTMLRFARASGFEVRSVPQDPAKRRIVKKL